MTMDIAMQAFRPWAAGYPTPAARHVDATAPAVGSTRRAHRPPRSRAAGGFAARVTAERCLAVEGGTDCTVRVVEGEVWVTVEGQPEDTIAGAGARLDLAANACTFIGAFRDAAVLIEPRQRSRRVAFALRDEMGLRVLTVTVGLGGSGRALAWLRRLASGFTKAYVAYAQRRFDARRGLV